MERYGGDDVVGLMKEQKSGSVGELDKITRSVAHPRGR